MTGSRIVAIQITQEGLGSAGIIGGVTTSGSSKSWVKTALRARRRSTRCSRDSEREASLWRRLGGTLTSWLGTHGPAAARALSPSVLEFTMTSKRAISTAVALACVV